MTEAVNPVLADTFPKLLALHMRERGGAVAFRHKCRGIWQAMTWVAAYRLVGELAAGFAALGIKAGDRVAIAGSNNPRLYCSITAVQVLGAVPVLLHADAPAVELARLIADANASLAIVEGQENADKILARRLSVPSLRTILYHHDRGMREYDRTLFRPLEDVRAAGQTWLADPGRAGWLEDRMAAGKPSDVACILYTAGTTGAQRGVVLASGRCIEAARSTVKLDDLGQDDLAFADLSPATIDGFYFIYAQSMVAGLCIACPESLETAPHDLREIGATFHCVYPQQLKDMASQADIRMAGAGRVRRWIFQHFIGAAERRHEMSLKGMPPPLFLQIHYIVGDVLIYGPLKSALGLSHIRTMYVTSDAASERLLKFYRAIGINLKQCYGQAEACYQIATQSDRPEGYQSLRAAPGVSLRLSDRGEIEFRSPGMFRGYLDADDLDGQRFTDDGFVRSGDLGVLDEKGGLTVVDRMEDVGRLASGRSFSPKVIEVRLKESRYIREVAAFGDSLDSIVCLVSIDFPIVGEWAARHGAVYSSHADLIENPDVIDLVRLELDRVNRELRAHFSGLGAEVSRFAILPWNFDADDDELTKTHKLKRHVVARRYRSIIDALSRGDDYAPLAVSRWGEDHRQDATGMRVHLHGVPGCPSAVRQSVQ